jgi:O-antigen/teichoic acid export membrane protein
MAFSRPLFSQLLHTHVDTGSACCIAIWLFASIIQRQVAETFRGLGNINWATVFGGLRNNGILVSVVSCAGAFVLSAMHALNLAHVFLVMALSSVLSAGIAISLLYAYLSGIVDRSRLSSRDFSFSAIGATWYEAWPLWVAMLATVLNNQGLGWLAGVLVEPENVALLGAAQRLMLLVIAPMVLATSVLPPLVARLHYQQEVKKLGRVVQSFAGLIAIPSFAIFIFFLLFGDDVLANIFGEYYRRSYQLLLLLCMGQVANCATGAWQIILPMTGRRREALLLGIGGFLAQLLFCAGLGWKWGVLGIAAGFSLAMIVLNLMGMFVVRKILGIWTFSYTNPRQLIEVWWALSGSLLYRRT